MRFAPDYQLRSLSELLRFCEQFVACIPLGATIGLSGELGAGKTEFVRNILRVLGVRCAIPSPTFVLENCYDIQLQGTEAELRHWDLYRLKVQEIPEDLLDSIRDERCVTCIEWPEIVPGILGFLDIRLILAFPDSRSEDPEPGIETLGEQRSVEIHVSQDPLGQDFGRALLPRIEQFAKRV